MKLILNLILIYCLIISQAFGQATNPNDQMKIGDKSSSIDKGFTFETGDGVSNKKLLVEKISKKLKWNGNSVQIGDGSASSDKELIIAGALKSLKYNGTSGEFEFNDDVKLIGSLKTDIIQAINSEVDVKNILRAELGVKFGTGNAEIKYDTGLNSLVFSNDGTLYKKVGSGSGGGDGGVSILKNGSFEDGDMNWTSTGGSHVISSYANGTESDLKYATFTATSASQTFCSDLATTPSYFGAGGMVDFTYTGTGTAFLMYVVDSLGNKLTAPQVLLNQTAWTKLSPIPFSFNTSQKICFESIGASSISVDKVYLGSNKGTGNVGYIKEGYVRYDINSSFNISGTFDSENLDYFATVDDTTYTDGLRIVAKVPCKLDVSAYLNNSNSAGPIVELQIFKNGVIISKGRIYTYNGNTDVSTVVSTPILLAKDDVVKIYYFNPVTFAAAGAALKFQKTSTDQVQTPEASQWMIDASVGGNDAMASVSTSYKPFENGSLDMWVNQGSSPVKIACANAYATGLTCSGNEQVGAVFTNPYSGFFEACFSATFDNPSGHAMGVQVVETPANSDVITQEGKSRVMFTNDGGGTTNSIGSKVCGTFFFSDVKERAIKLAYESDSTTNRIRASRRSSFGQEDIHITIRPLLQNSLRAILTGDQVTTPNVKNPKVVSFEFGGNTRGSLCTSSPCTVHAQLGATGIITTRSALGDYQVSFPVGTWSSDEYQCAAAGFQATVGYCGMFNNTMRTKTNMRVFGGGGTGSSFSDASCNFVCHGY